MHINAVQDQVETCHRDTMPCSFYMHYYIDIVAHTTAFDTKYEYDVSLTTS